MGLPMNLLKEFAKQVSSGEKKEQSTTYYGEILSKTENEVTVQLDGSDVSTPADCTMDAEVGDRVMVQIKDHKAVVVGNATSPASARTASAFMRLTDDGLVIGTIANAESGAEEYTDTFDGDDTTVTFNLTKPIKSGVVTVKVDGDEQVLDTDYTYDDSNNSITFLTAPEEYATIEIHYLVAAPLSYLLLSGNSYYIKEQSIDSSTGELNPINPSTDATIAVFQKNLLSFLEDKAYFSLNDEDEHAELYGENALTLYANSDMMGTALIALQPYIASVAAYKQRSVARIVIEADEENPIFEYGSYGGGSSPTSEKLLKKSDVFPLYKTGSVSKTATITGNSYATITSDAITVPSGYTILGIRAIDQNHQSVCHLTRFGVDMTNKKCWASFHNDSNNDQSTTVTFHYFCIRSS